MQTRPPIRHSSPDKPRLLFICLGLSSFVKEDIKLLGEQYDVRIFLFDANRFSSKLGHLFGLIYYGIKQLLWLLRELPRARIVYGWFADYHMVVPVWMARRGGVPICTALGGFDANTLPSIGYGVYESRWRRPLARFVLEESSRLLPVSEALVHSSNTFSSFPDRLENGIRIHAPDCHTPYTVLPTGFDAAVWPAGPSERPDVITTVAFLSDFSTTYVKGIDIFIETARLLPEVVFQIVGVDKSFESTLRSRFQLPENVRIVTPIPRSRLVEIYHGTSVYAQLSRTEGLPNVLCEAMSCGCIPVGSPVAAIPEVIGSTGYLVETPVPSHVAGVLHGALESGSPARRRATRQRISEHFVMDIRRRDLVAVIDSEIADG